VNTARLALALAFAATANTFAQTERRPQLRAGALVGTVAVDGVLDEAVWQGLDVADAFMQVEPAEGTAVSAPTRMRVLAGTKTIVIGIECDDPNPAGIVSFSKQRDAELGSEDHVRVVLGPYPRRTIRLRVRGESVRGTLRRAHRAGWRG
jgi:hypothetical protein